jgi:hypothetical protein
MYEGTRELLRWAKQVGYNTAMQEVGMARKPAPGPTLKEKVVKQRNPLVRK